MKAEDAVRLFNEVRAEFERLYPGVAVLEFTGLTAAFQTAFAREQHGIERAKELARINEDWDGNVESEPAHTIDWSALDAEIEKENEDG